MHPIRLRAVIERRAESCSAGLPVPPAMPRQCSRSASAASVAASTGSVSTTPTLK